MQITFDKNIACNPAILKQFGQYHNIVRDVLIYISYKKSEISPLQLSFVLPEFYKMFGYNRQYLLKKCTKQEQDELKAANLEGTTIIDYVLLQLVRSKLVTAYWGTNSQGQKKTVEGGIHFLDKLHIERTARGVRYTFDVNPLFVKNCKGSHYVTFEHLDYLRLKFDGKLLKDGSYSNPQPDHDCRMLFLRLLFADQYQTDVLNLGEILTICSIKYKRRRAKIAKLNEMLEKIRINTTLKTTYDTEYDSYNNTYTLVRRK